MKVSKSLVVAAVGLSVAGTLIGAGVAQADPQGTPAGNTRPIQGFGSDTTMEVLNDLANAVTVSGSKVISSWDISGSANVSTKSSDPDCVYPARPNGSGNGRKALGDAITPGKNILGTSSPADGCVNFARSSGVSSSSSFPASGDDTQNFTYIPFAKDSLAFALTKSSTIPTGASMSVADLQAMYKCTYPGFEDSSPAAGWQSTYKALIAQPGSGTAPFWWQNVIWAGATAPSLTSAAAMAPYGCVVNKTDYSGYEPNALAPGLIQEHRANVLKDNMIVGVSVAQYMTQLAGKSTNFTGNTLLGTIVDNTDVPTEYSYPTLLNIDYSGIGAASPIATRDVYNVVQSSAIADATPGNSADDSVLDQVFSDEDGAGSADSSLVCTATKTILNQAFGLLGNNCGSIALKRLKETN